MQVQPVPTAPFTSPTGPTRAVPERLKVKKLVIDSYFTEANLTPVLIVFLQTKEPVKDDWNSGLNMMKPLQHRRPSL